MCKAGYRFLKEEEALPTQTKANPQDKSLWKGVWSLDSTNKVKHFTWRASHNSLPTKQNLVGRIVLDSPICYRCQAASETPLHAL